MILREVKNVTFFSNLKDDEEAKVEQELDNMSQYLEIERQIIN